MRPFRLRLALLGTLICVAAACSEGAAPSRLDGSIVRPGPTPDFGNSKAGLDAGDDAGELQRPGADAFFIMDDPPPYCGPDGERETLPPPGGTAECPLDKNREGCPCERAGEQAACWPGRRINRRHGICEDGVTRCVESPEFGLLWGPCEGYVLPVAGVLGGPDACRCFSNGKWRFENLVPCPVSEGETGPLFFYSSHLDNGQPVCDPVGALPPDAPAVDWGRSVLNVDCAGRFELCYMIKAGRVDEPADDDCVVTRQCFDIWYEEAGTDLSIDVPGWASEDGACGREFRERGGYGEMSVRGLSVECDDIDDGQGGPLVFFRTGYCRADCDQTPDDPACRKCATDGEGGF